jgi:mannose-6-phosphate isomerase-like protein (cupin superfamily)
MKLISLIPLFGALMLQGSAPGAVQVWKSSDIHSKGQTLAGKLDANKVASEVIATEGNRTFMVAHREASGLAEVHDTQADVMFISEGEAIMVYGGTVVEGKTTAPGETRGSGIKGGTEVKLGPGDVLHIPAKIPHQMKLAPGAKVTYFVTKVVQ